MSESRQRSLLQQGQTHVARGRLLVPVPGNASREHLMTMYKSLMLAGTVIGFLPLAPAWAAEPSKGGIGIADNDGIFIDGRSFKIVTGHANGEGSAMVQKSGARELGPAAIVFRKGDKLYLATVRPDRRYYGGSENRDYGGSENRDYGGSENRDYGGYVLPGSTAGVNPAYHPRWFPNYPGVNNAPSGNPYAFAPCFDAFGNAYYPTSDSDCLARNSSASNRDYGGSENRDYGGGGYRDYGNARSRQADQSRSQQSAFDPDYAQYKLRKLFDENWTTTESK
jgi:hypothetical protein